MSKICPFTNEKVVYLDCIECDDKNKCGTAPYKAETNVSLYGKYNLKAISVISFGYTIEEAKISALENVKAALKKITKDRKIKVILQQVVCFNDEYVDSDEGEIEIEL